MKGAFAGLCGLIAIATFLGTTAVTATARAEDDPWTGEDKTKHFVVSAGIAAGGYVGGVFLFDKRGCALATGAGLAALAGVGKELVDLAGYGQASWKDLAWDGLGMLGGLALAWGVDLLVRGVSPQHPAIGLIRSESGGIAF